MTLARNDGGNGPIVYEMLAKMLDPSFQYNTDEILAKVATFSHDEQLKFHVLLANMATHIHTIGLSTCRSIEMDGDIFWNHFKVHVRQANPQKRELYLRVAPSTVINASSSSTTYPSQ